MTKVLTVRLKAEEMARCDAAAKCLGLTRTEYVRYRLFRDAAEEETHGPGFVSRDLVGAYAVGTGSANPEVRKALARNAR